MSRTRRRTAIAAAAVAGLALAGCAATSEPEAAGTPTRSATTASAVEDAPTEAPARDNPFIFEANLVGGGTIDGETLMGEDVILWFWAPWCPTCLVEGKDAVAEAIAQMPEGVELVGIAGRITSDEEVDEFLDFTGVGDARHIADEDGALWEGFGVVLQPAFLFVNDDGTFEKGGAGLTTEDILDQADRLAAS